MQCQLPSARWPSPRYASLPPGHLPAMPSCPLAISPPCQSPPGYVQAWPCSPHPHTGVLCSAYDARLPNVSAGARREDQDGDARHGRGARHGGESLHYRPRSKKHVGTLHQAGPTLDGGMCGSNTVPCQPHCHYLCLSQCQPGDHPLGRSDPLTATFCLKPAVSARLKGSTALHFTTALELEWAIYDSFLSALVFVLLPD